MSNKKPEPIIPRQEPNLCPICGKASYSAAGIHPQCAVKQADGERHIGIKQNAGKKTKKPPKTVSRWQKTCPSCRASLHVRKKACDCGHNFG